MTIRQVTIERDPVLMQGREGRWRWPWAILGVIVTVIFAGLLSIVIALPLTSEMGALSSEADSEFELDPRRPYTFVRWIVLFLPLLVAPLLTLWCVHGVSWRRAFSYSGGFEWGQFVRAAAACLLVTSATAVLLFCWRPQYFRSQLPSADYIPWFVFGFAVIFVQSLSEEVFFKGYLLRVWGAVLPFRLPITGAVILLFVLFHLPNADMRNDTGLKLIYVALFEAVSFVLFFRTQNLGAAAGFHWMYNVSLVLLMTNERSGSPAMALSMYINPAGLRDPYDHVVLVLCYVLLIVLLTWPRSPFYLRKASQLPKSVQ
jgi:membrane protease YdiL (CAAX protease family)